MSAVRLGRIVNRAIHRSRLQRSRPKLMDSRPGNINIIWLDIATIADAIVLDGPDDGGPYAHVWIEHDIALVGQRKDEPFDKLNWKLTGMYRLFNVIVLYVWKNPNVPGIFSKRVPRKLADLWPLKIFFVRVFGRHPDRIEIECVVVRFRKPKNSFVPSGESLRTVEAMLEVPDNAIPQSQSVILEYVEKNNVERKHLAVLNVIADLPANRALVME